MFNAEVGNGTDRRDGQVAIENDERGLGYLGLEGCCALGSDLSNDLGVADSRELLAAFVHDRVAQRSLARCCHRAAVAGAAGLGRSWKCEDASRRHSQLVHVIDRDLTKHVVGNDSDKQRVEAAEASQRLCNIASDTTPLQRDRTRSSCPWQQLLRGLRQHIDDRRTKHDHPMLRGVYMSYWMDAGIANSCKIDCNLCADLCIVLDKRDVCK